MKLAKNQREMTIDECLPLTQYVDSKPGVSRKFREGAENALVMWAAFSLLLIIIWLFIAWVARSFASIEVGFQSTYAFIILATIVCLCGIYAIWSSVKWVRDWPDHYPGIEQDIANRVVEDQEFHVKEIKLFEEPEHGGLIHFLRMENEDVLVLYDHASVEPRTGENSENSPLQPRRQLRIVSAPISGYFIDQYFSGESIDIPEPLIIAAKPEKWPEDESWCDISWDNLEKHLC